jgi:hypothetical protein
METIILKQKQSGNLIFYGLLLFSLSVAMIIIGITVMIGLRRNMRMKDTNQ